MTDTLRHLFAAPLALRERMRRRPDSEHEMAVNRIVIATVFYIAVVIVRSVADMHYDLSMATRVYAAYCAAAFTIIGAILIWPGAVRARRLATLALDLGAGTFASHAAGPTGVGFLYPCYLLIIYGYGFRYGANWLILSSAGSFASLAAVAAFSPHWDKQYAMIGGLLVGLIIIPAYAYQLVRGLWAAKAQAEASNRAKSLFVASVSHDLRTPLNAIIGLGDLLASSKIPAEESDMAHMIGAAGRSLLGLIDSILDFSRLEMGRADLSITRVDLPALLRELRDLISVSAEAKSVGLTLRAETALPRHVLTSERHIKDALTNLIGNAIKFTEEGRVDIVVAAQPAAVGVTRLRFEIRDTGIGVDADAQARIFERFTQADETIRDTYGGSGLGLAIVSQLVGALGGRVGVASAQGRGSCFWFEIDVTLAAPEPPARADGLAALVFTEDATLVAALKATGADPVVLGAGDDLARRLQTQSTPFVIVIDQALANGLNEAFVVEAAALAARKRVGLAFIGAHDVSRRFSMPVAPYIAEVAARRDSDALAQALLFVAPPQAPARRDPCAEVAHAPCRILVVEDNRTNQKVIEKMLGRAGHRIAIAANGQIALDMLEQERFDLVLMDINMPVVDGVEATRRLRARERPEDATPVVALTADVTPRTRARCAEAGMNDCLTKPVEHGELLRLVDQWSRARRRSRALLAASPASIGAARPTARAPRPAPTQGPALDMRAIGDLCALGGADFVTEIARQFVADGVAILTALTAAVQDRDVDRFKDEAHALRSCSANIGAQNLYELCLSWRQVGAQEFAANGATYIVRLEQEFARVRQELAPYLDVA